MRSCALLLWLVGAGCTRDADRDGFTAREDCDDGDPDVFPGATEACDGRDTDCNGVIDDADPTAALTGLVWYLDADEDGFGDSDQAQCAEAPGRSQRGGDCDDLDPEVSPGAPEVCSNGIDDDCDGRVDVDPTVPLYADDDADGFGDPARPVEGCPPWAVDNDDDCNDTDPALLDASSTLWYADADGDGWGVGPATAACLPPTPGATLTVGDCDDAEPAMHPGHVELCDGLDNDCDATVDGPEAWRGDGTGLRWRVTIGVPSVEAPAAPIVFDLDFRAELDAAGLPDPFDPAGLRAVVQTCVDGEGLAELPVAFVDGETAWTTAGGGLDPLGDEHGAVVVLWDTDGDAATEETLAAGQTLELALYLQDLPVDTAFTSAVLASAGGLGNGRVQATLDGGAGGLLSSIVLDGSPSLGSQGDATGGNGLHTDSGPLSAQAPASTDAVVVNDHGPVTASVTSSGHLTDATGATDYAYTYRVFAGSPELWIRTAFRTTEPTLARDPLGVEVTEVLRPLQLAHPVSGACTTDPNLHWADVSAGGWGLTWLWAAPPQYVTALGCTGSESWTAANDYRDVTGMDSGTIVVNTDWVDGPIVVLLPHSADAAAAQDRRAARLEGHRITVGTVELP